MAEDTGAPNGDGAPDGEGKDTSKDDFVPKTQFIAALNSAERKYEGEISGLKAQLAELKAEAKKPDPPKKYTRAELTQMVESRQITQEQADAQLDYQTREDAKAEARGVATEVYTAAQRKSYVDTEIARYKAVAPEILDEAHEIRTRIAEEYQYLVGQLGDQNSVETQLKAIRAVLGPVEKLEKSRNARSAHEPHRESGGQGGETSRKKSGALTYDDLSTREKTHYDKLIASGTYKDRAAVNEELKYANAITRRKYGAMN